LDNRTVNNISNVCAAPVAALVADAAIAVAIRDAAVEADFRTPIAFMKGIDAVVPAPISWRPQQLRFRRQRPRARYPVIARIVIPGPIAGRPDVAWGRDRRLIVNRQWRRRDIDSCADAVFSIRRRDRTILRRNSEPRSVGLLLITSILVITVTTRPQLAFCTDRGTGGTTDDRTNGRPAAAA
jgi:hypothetical protein